jgi:hypothetical protein
MSDGGKGDAPRPYSVSQEEFDNRWETIFGKKPRGGMPAEQAESLGTQQPEQTTGD